MNKKVLELCKENNVELLYCIKFGSHLYGTNTPESDVDYKGIFLPSKEDCYLMKSLDHITYSSGKKDTKNTSDDVDIQLWSLQYFLKLVAKGETGALDLLFSFSNEDVIEYDTPMFNKIFNHYDELFNIRDCNAFTGYAIGQAKKYGIKGSRLGKLKQVYNKVMCYFNNKDFKLNDIIDDIIQECGDKSLCFIKDINGIKSLVLNNKVHNSTIKLEEFRTRIITEYSKYGDRAREAEKDNGIDWKAMSHALRSLFQMEELINTGRIQFPLKRVDEIIKVKKGNVSFKELEEQISSGIKKIDERLIDPNLIIFNIKNDTFIKEFILSFYK